MDERYRAKLESLADNLVRPERFGAVAVEASVEPQIEFDLDLPRAAIYYFPDRTPPEDTAA